MNESEKKYAATKKKYDGPYSGSYHDSILCDGALFMRFNVDRIDVNMVAIAMNEAFNAGKAAAEAEKNEKHQE